MKARLVAAATAFAVAFGSISLGVKPSVAGDLIQFRRPLTIPFKGVSAYSPQKATLGKMLFFDPRLSGAKNLNCASCHNPSFGFEAPASGSVGASNEPLARNAPTILNMAWVSPNFWDGRADSLEEQAAGPITASAEMNGDFHDIERDLKNIPDYVDWFAQVFPDEGITRETILASIATYERTVVSDWSPFDRWVEGDEKAVSDSAKRGFELFVGKANCVACHSGWNFTDNKFHDIGLYSDDIGRAKLERGNPKAMYAFKTPGLRNAAYRAPYMHDGTIETFEAVILHYESGGMERPSRSDLIAPFELTEEERADLVEFLGSLTAEKQNASLPILPN